MGYVCPYPLDPRNISESNNLWCDVDPTIVKIGLLQSINPGDIVVLRLNFPKHQYLKYTGLTVNTADIYTAYDKEIESLYHGIVARGGSFLLIGSNPTVDLNPECLNPQWFNSLQRTNCEYINIITSLSGYFSVNHDLHLLNKYAGKYPDFDVIAPTQVLCDINRYVCPLKLEGGFLYKDNEHISSVAVDLIYPQILSSLHHLSGKR